MKLKLMRFFSELRPSRRRCVQRISTFHELLLVGALCARFESPSRSFVDIQDKLTNQHASAAAAEARFLTSRQGLNDLHLPSACEKANVCSWVQEPSLPRLTSSKDHPHQLSETEKIVERLCLHLLKSIKTTINNNNNIALEFYCLFRVPFPRTQRCRPKIRMPGI